MTRLICSHSFFIALFVVVLLSVFAIINFKKRSDAEQELRNVKRKLEQSYMELGETYQQVKMTQRELAGRYEELKKVKNEIRSWHIQIM